MKTITSVSGFESKSEFSHDLSELSEPGYPGKASELGGQSELCEPSSELAFEHIYDPNLTPDQVHQIAVSTAKRYMRVEADLIVVLQRVYKDRVHLSKKKTSLTSYAIESLGLSEAVASSFVTVANKAREIPALQAAIRLGEVTVSKVRKITPVLTVENSFEWIEKVKTLPQWKLEKEVARACPREAVQERIKPVAEDRNEMRVGISDALEEKLRRIRDLESQRQGRAVSLEGALEAMAEVYLEVKDPVKRAERVLARAERGKPGAERVRPGVGDVIARAKRAKLEPRPQAKESSKNDAPAPVLRQTSNAPAPVLRRVTKATRRDAIPAHVVHPVNLRDQAQCTRIGPGGKRCENRRWLHLHHVKPRAQGGEHSLANLRTLCSAHHRMLHGQG